jgi:hypothetical protein
MHQMRARDDAQAATAAKPPLKQRLSALFEEYGRIAVITYFTLSILTIIGFSVAIWTGVQPSSETGVLGVIIAGWALGKATLPIRIPITLALTPVVAYVVRRRRGAPDRGDQGEPGDAAAPDGTPPAPGAGAP